MQTYSASCDNWQSLRRLSHTVTLDLLEKANFTPQQARFVAQAIETEVEAHPHHLATNEDLLQVKSELEKDIHFRAGATRLQAGCGPAASPETVAGGICATAQGQCEHSAGMGAGSPG